jgi:fatty-acyl-CoA synthase
LYVLGGKMTQLVIDGPEWWARAEPEKTALQFERASLSYGELNDWADRAAADLASRGVEAGDRVGILAGNCMEYCVAVLAMAKAGAVIVPMNTRLTPKELAVLTTSSEPKIVYTDEDLADTAAEVAGLGPNFDRVLLAELSGMREGERAPFTRPEVDPAEPAALIYTSGTTGQPKGVIFTNKSILGFIHEWGLTEPGFRHDMRQIMVLPLGGAPGTIWGIIHCFVRGGTFVLHRQFDPDAAVRSIEEDKVTCMLGVPLLFEAMAAQERFADADLSSWDTGHVGGAPVSDALLRTYKEKGVLLRQIYGMTEAGGSATVNPREEALTKPDYCGQGGPFTKIRVIRDDGTDCDPGEPGEIVIKGPSVTPGYWRNEEATAETIVDGWLHSGDIGMLDERGFLKMLERKKDMIISGGLNIAPAEIENAIMELDSVEEVAVIAAPDEKFGETPAAVIRPRGELTAEEVVSHCDERVADFKVPRYVIISDEPLPRMASGKIAKRILRDAHPDIAETHARVR